MAAVVAESDSDHPESQCLNRLQFSVVAFLAAERAAASAAAPEEEKEVVVLVV